VKLPTWLNPWWHLDFDLATPLAIDEVRAALCQQTARLRGYTAPDGSLVVVRRGGLMNQFVRAFVHLAAGPSGTFVNVQVRPLRRTSIFFTLALPFLFLGLILQVTEVGFKSGLSVAASYWPFFPIVPALWAVVRVVNYTSERSEAGDLQRLISAALNPAASSTPSSS
jgi:hypothetical protein